MTEEVERSERVLSLKKVNILQEKIQLYSKNIASKKWDLLMSDHAIFHINKNFKVIRKIIYHHIN